jgi:hypothetical protein
MSLVGVTLCLPIDSVPFVEMGGRSAIWGVLSDGCVYQVKHHIYSTMVTPDLIWQLALKYLL